MFYSFVRQSKYPPSWVDLLLAAHASSLFAGLLDFSLHGSKKGSKKGEVLPLQRSVSSVGHSKGRLNLPSFNSLLEPAQASDLQSSL